MPRVLSDEHKAAMAAGRARRAAEGAVVREREWARYRVWSREDARLTREIMALEGEGEDAAAQRAERIALVREMGKIPTADLTEDGPVE
jgi:hypothetical protein